MPPCIARRVLRMARPWQDPKNHVWHLRQRTPSDLLVKLKGQAVTLPIGDGFSTVTIGGLVQVSLRTKDNREAKELHARADAALRRFWEAQRRGPVRLSNKQCAALAGTLYGAFVSGIEDNPGPPELWAEVQAVNEDVRNGRLGLSAFLLADASGRTSHAREDRFGRLTDHLLAREGLVIDEESRALLVKAVQKAMEDVTGRGAAFSNFDYSPDPAADSFPLWEPPTVTDSATAVAGRGRGSKAEGKLTADALFEAWSAFNQGKKAPNTIKRYDASFRSLAAFFKAKDVRTLTGDDLHAWAEHRKAKENVTARSVNKNDLVAASSVFKWAMSREGGKQMASNPAISVKLTEEAKGRRERERTFRTEEIAAILSAALAVKDEPKNPTSAFARRWCPWLAAYTGARITELTGLLGSDIRRDGKVPVIDFRKTKTGEPRTVPIHDHLIEQGFLEFAASRANLPLFLDPKRHGKNAKTDPAEIRSRKVAQWVRDTVSLDKSLQPDHGWRHTWKTRALGAGIEEKIRDAITGHSVKSVARGYEHPPVTMLAEAMQRFPRYEL